MKETKLFLLVFLSVSSLLFAQTDWGENMEFVDIPIESSYPSGVIMGDYSVGMDILGIILWSIADPDNPQYYGRLPIRGDQYDWFIQDDILYVCTDFEDQGFLDVINMQDPAHPQYVSEVRLPDEQQGIFSGIFPHGDYIYTTSQRYEFMHRFSINNDAMHPELTDWQENSLGKPLCYRENLLISCLTDEDRNSFLYISVMAENGRVGGTVFELGVRPVHRTSLRDDLLFVHAGQDWIIIDISNPEDARITAELEGIFVSNGNGSLHRSETIRFHRDIGDNIAVGDLNSLKIFNVDDPEHPELRASFQCPENHWMFPSLVVGERLYTPVCENRPIDFFTDTLNLQIYDVSDPDDPEVISDIPIMTYCPSQIAISNEDNLAGFVNCNSHFNIYEIGEDESFELRSIIQSEEMGLGNRLNSVSGAIHDNMAFITKGTEGSFAYSLDDPSNPELMFDFDIQHAFVQGVFDSILFLTVSGRSLQRIDVSRREQFEVLPVINFEEILYGTLRKMDDLFVARESDQVSVYSIEENNTLQQICSHQVRSNIYPAKIAVLDTLIITSDYGDNGRYEDWELMTLDYDEENDALTLLDRVEWYSGDPKYEVPLAARNDGLVAAAGNTRIVIFDVTNPRSVNIVATSLTPNRSYEGIAWHGDYLYSVGANDICRFRMIVSDETPTVTPDTLDFGVRPQFSVNWLSYTLRVPGETGLLRIAESGFECDNDAFVGFNGLKGWLSAGFEKADSIRFRPLEVDAYTARIWFRTENDSFSVFLKGITEGYDGISAEKTALPQEYAITDIYPNPFNSSASISYTVPEQSEVTLLIYDTQGKLVKVLVEGIMPAGGHQVVVNGGDLSSGVYLVQMVSGNRKNDAGLEKIILIR